jgi:hypothetical protein
MKKWLLSLTGNEKPLKIVGGLTFKIENKMIKDDKNEKTTPKKKAQDILMDKVSVALGYWTEGDYDSEVMTVKERVEVQRQMKIQADRIAKMFGFDEAWES